MPSIQNITILLAVYFTLGCCYLNSSDKNSTGSKDSLTLKIEFSPAFDERSEVLLLKTDSIKFIQLLIKNNFRADKNEDTFWFKRINLTTSGFLQLDTTLVNLSRQKFDQKEYHDLDGMGINSLLINNGDTNNIYFHSPSKTTDSIGYNYTNLMVGILKKTFQDTLVNQYFNDLEEYIDESKSHKADTSRILDQLRMKKYSWTIKSP